MAGDMTHGMTDGVARAEACANIALAKYWGKASRDGNFTAVPSLSLTLDSLRTRTEVQFSSELTADEATLDGVPVTGRPLERIVDMLERVRALSGESRLARVTSCNSFPTAAGLASSASGFAALALASTRAAGHDASVQVLSSLARQSSASAARSLFGGFAELLTEAESAAPVAPVNHWPLTMFVAVVTAEAKPIGSTGGMIHTKRTSPFYQSWVDDAPNVFERVRRAVLQRNFDELVSAMEHSALAMHATMFAAQPPVVYFRPATLEVIDRVTTWRNDGLPLGFTMDAGPNVKVLTPSEHADEVAARLATIPAVTKVIRCGPGPAARLLSLDGSLEQALPLPDSSLPDDEPRSGKPL